MKSDFTRWAMAPASWITASAESLGDIVISTRIRIARNVPLYPFPHNAPNNVQTQLRSKVFEAAKLSTSLNRSIPFFLNELSSLEKSFLIERHLISVLHAKEQGEKGLIVSSGESISIMVNEEDHIRAATFSPGFSFSEAWDLLKTIDEDLEKHVPYAFDPKLGYLTACPTNVGTGMRVSFLLHLPVLVLTGKIQDTINRLSQMGFTTRGVYGEGTQGLGDLFQISNSNTLGLSERAILESTEKVVKQVTQTEKKETQSLLASEKNRAFEDLVFRSYGTLQSARMLNYEETMGCLSLIRLGKKMGMDIRPSLQGITNLFFLCQPAHLWIRSEKHPTTAQEEGVLRAEYTRKSLKKIS